MNQQPKAVDVPVYLVVQPTWSRWNRDAEGHLILEGGRVEKSTQKRPTVPREGVVLKLTLRVPASAFLPLQPEVVVEVGMDDTETVTAEAVDPREFGDD